MRSRFSEKLISLKIPSLEKSSDNNLPGKKENQKKPSPGDGLQPINGDWLACVAVDLEIIACQPGASEVSFRSRKWN